MNLSIHVHLCLHPDPGKSVWMATRDHKMWIAPLIRHLRLIFVALKVAFKFWKRCRLTELFKLQTTTIAQLNYWMIWALFYVCFSKLPQETDFPWDTMLTWDWVHPGLGSPAGWRQSEQGYLAQAGSLPVAFASLQYLSFKMNAADLGCLCLLKIPFLFPTTRVIPADTKEMNRETCHRAQKQRNVLSGQKFASISVSFCRWTKSLNFSISCQYLFLIL